MQRLVADDEDEEYDKNTAGVWASLAQYGFSPQEEARVNEIDELLKYYRDFQELLTDGDASDEAPSDGDEEEDYLRQVCCSCSQVLTGIVLVVHFCIRLSGRRESSKSGSKR